MIANIKKKNFMIKALAILASFIILGGIIIYLSIYLNSSKKPSDLIGNYIKTIEDVVYNYDSTNKNNTKDFNSKFTFKNPYSICNMPKKNNKKTGYCITEFPQIKFENSYQNINTPIKKTTIQPFTLALISHELLKLTRCLVNDNLICFNSICEAFSSKDNKLHVNTVKPIRIGSIYSINIGQIEYNAFLKNVELTESSQNHNYFKNLHFDIKSDHISEPLHVFLWGSNAHTYIDKQPVGNIDYREIYYSKYNPVIWTITGNYPISLRDKNFDYGIDIIKTVMLKLIKATSDLRAKRYYQKICL